MVSQGCGQLGCFLHRAAQSVLEPRHRQTPASDSLGGLISEEQAAAALLEIASQKGEQCVPALKAQRSEAQAAPSSGRCR